MFINPKIRGVRVLPTDCNINSLKVTTAQPNKHQHPIWQVKRETPRGQVGYPDPSEY